jgi:Fe-S oxidoreductase
MVDVVRGRQPVESGDGRRVIVWPDTFTNHFHPEVGIAAIELLRRLGFDVSLPDVPLCCGRPLYDYGMLTLAKRFLGRILAALRPEIRAGVPVVGLEPSCVAVFRDELPALLTDDPDAERLSAQTFVLSEFLEREAAGWHPGPIDRRALLHVHCHHRAVLDVRSELAVLERVGVEARIPEPGCCGMAGSFGFERGDRYEVSVRIGERALLPAVREADPDTLVVADGFSCRTQIEQGTGHRPMHLAELALLALQPPSARDPARQV